MIVEAFLSAIKLLVIGVISILPTVPKLDLSYLDGVFQVLSMADLVVNIRVFAGCLAVLFTFMNIELIWSVIMWCVRKIPGIN